MDRNSLIKRLMTTFLGELDEHVRSINRDLLALEKDPLGPGRAESFQSLLRAAHSLKGAARSVNVPPLEAASHVLEELFISGRDSRSTFDHELFTLLFAAADAIEEAGIRLREEADLADSPLTALIPHLEAAAIRVSKPEPEPETPIPPPSPVAPPLLPAPEPSNDASVGSAFVRVPAEKLDALLTHSGELLVARRRVGSRGDDLATIREFVNRWRAEWRLAEKPLAGLLGKPEVPGQVSSVTAPTAGPIPRRVAATLRRAGENLSRLERDLERLASAMSGDRGYLNRVAGLLEDEVRQARMFPFAEACQGLERTVRDVSQAVGKQVDLVIEGGSVEIDRSVLEALKDPLRHLVHNAIDHGVETPSRRFELGKSPRAQVTVSATLRGAEVEVTVVDDGGGLDLDRLKEQARRRGLDDSVDVHDLERLIFLPGFSTAGRITSISGRGVGLDVVKNRLEQLHGTIDVVSRPGQGSRFTMAVPLTLTTLRALLVLSGGQVFAFATTNVQTLVRVGPGDLKGVEGCRVLSTGGGPLLPVASLAETLGLPHRESSGKAPGVIVAAGERRMAFLVDEFLTEQEITVKGLGARVRHARFFSGATIQPSGKIALVLNAASLIRAALARGASPAPASTSTPARPRLSLPSKKRLLIVDDSVTTRSLGKGLLEAAGYEVTTAVDGEAGWRVLQEWKPDLLISDVEMPRMDGFALTRAVRGSVRFAHLPVILLTTRGSEEDRARGIEVGADAYIIKGSADQQPLLEAVAQLL